MKTVFLTFAPAKFRQSEDLPRAVGDIYAAIREGERVIAIVPAFEADRASLLEEAVRFGGGADEPYGAAHLGLGALRAASLLAVACDQAGLKAKVLTPDEAGVGPALASGEGAGSKALGALIAAYDVTIVPAGSGDESVAVIERALARALDIAVPAIKAAPPVLSPLKVALAGCGIVGTGLADLIAGRRDQFNVCAVLVRDLNKKRTGNISGAKLVDNMDALFETQPDIIVDVLSSGEAGLALTKAALARGISIASANKQALADDLPKLHSLAAENGAILEYSAAVGGGAPMIETVRRTARKAAQGASPIARIDAVVNGTVNYILSELAAGADFDGAVKAAQEAGFAEADPSADLSGADAVAKAKILSHEAFNAPIGGEFPYEALDQDRLSIIAKEPGVWRQMTCIALSDGEPRASVEYHRVDEGDFFCDFAGERNGVRLTLENGETIAAKGRGAGPVPTAHSVLGDLGAIAAARLAK